MAWLSCGKERARNTLLRVNNGDVDHFFKESSGLLVLLLGERGNSNMKQCEGKDKGLTVLCSRFAEDILQGCQRVSSAAQTFAEDAVQTNNCSQTLRRPYYAS